MSYKLFIKDIPKNTPSHEIKHYLCKRVKLLSFKKSKNKGKSINNYVIIEVRTNKEAKFLLDKPHVFRGNLLGITRYLTETQRKERASSVVKKRIFLNDLNLGATEDFVLNTFQKFGEIESIFLKKKFIDETQRYGIVYCFITFEEESSVNKVLFQKQFFYEQYRITLIKSVEESRKLNEAKYAQIVQMTENCGISKTSNYYNEKSDSEESQQVDKRMQL